MRRRITGLILFLLLAAVACFLLYPTVSDQLSRRRDAEIMSVYREKTAAMDEGQRAELLDGAKAWNESLESIHTEDVFSSGTSRTTRDYQNRMNVHNGVIAELVIPGIGVSLPVYHLSSETPAERYLVHVDTSSLPSDSSGENIVLAGPGVLRAEGIPGDLGLTDGRMLEDADHLVPGDLLILNVLDRTMVYRVYGVQVRSSAGIQGVDLTPEEGEERLTLITLRKDQRLLVQTGRIPVGEARTLLAETDYVTFAADWQNVLLLGLPVLLAGLLILCIIVKIRGMNYRLPGEGKKATPKARETMKQTVSENDKGEET